MRLAKAEVRREIEYPNANVLKLSRGLSVVRYTPPFIANSVAENANLIEYSGPVEEEYGPQTMTMLRNSSQLQEGFSQSALIGGPVVPSVLRSVAIKKGNIYRKIRRRQCGSGGMRKVSKRAEDGEFALPTDCHRKRNGPFSNSAHFLIKNVFALE